MVQGNIYESIPASLEQEEIRTLLESNSMRILRIVSRGQSSPLSGWYDQQENEWVIVLRGSACLTFDDGRCLRLNAGDFVDIPSHSRHRVEWTDPDGETLWLAVHYT